METPLLPYDVLLRVASFCSQDTLARLTAVNRDIHDACVLMLLDEPVKLTDSKTVMSLLDFLDADANTRWPRLRALVFGDKRLDEDAASRLAVRLPFAVSLESLKFRHAERTFSSQPELGAALVELESVTDVVIHHVGPRAAEMLLRMHWELEHAALAHISGPEPTRDQYAVDHTSNPEDDKVAEEDGKVEGGEDPESDSEHSEHDHDSDDDEVEDPENSEDEDDDDEEDVRYDAQWLLKNADWSLKELELHDWFTPDVYHGLWPMFTELELLKFSTSTVYYPRSIQWVWSYYNLWDLDVRIGRNRSIPLTAVEVEEVEEARRKNLDDHTRESWKYGLRSSRGSVLDFYALGIPCTIYRLTLELYTEDMRLVPTILETARPTILLLGLQDNVQISEVAKIFGMAGTEGLAGVTVHKISVKLTESDDPGIVVEGIMDELITALAPRSVQVLRVRLSLIDPDISTKSEGASDRIDSYVNALDMDKLSARIFGAAITLETAFLHFNWHKGSAQSERTIQMSKGGDIVVE